MHIKSEKEDRIVRQHLFDDLTQICNTLISTINPVNAPTMQEILVEAQPLDTVALDNLVIYLQKFAKARSKKYLYQATPLIIHSGLTHCCQLIIGLGADMSRIDEFGVTPLHRAVMYNRSAIAALILKCPNVDVNAQSRISGESALHYAVLAKNPEMINMLIQLGNANIGIQNKDGETPLEMVHKLGLNTNSQLEIYREAAF